jgi:hypothetical protein
MKKNVIILIVLSFAMLSAKAQNESEYGPQKGNFAIAVSANPLLEYFGNFFGKSDKNSAPTANLANGYNLAGKYYLSNKNALRIGLNLAYNSESYFSGSDDENKTTEYASNIGMALGYELRAGSGRIQGYYGPSLGFGIINSGVNYNWDEVEDGDLLNEMDGTNFNIALGAFGGVEYFLTKNIALGTELGLGLILSSTGKGLRVYEGEDDVETGDKESSFSFGFNNTPAQLSPRGTIYVSFYF